MVAPAWLRDFARFCHDQRGFPVQAVIASVQSWPQADREWLRARWRRITRETQNHEEATRLLEVKTRKINAQLRAQREQRIIALEQQLGQLREWYSNAISLEWKHELENAIRRWVQELNELIVEETRAGHKMSERRGSHGGIHS